MWSYELNASRKRILKAAPRGVLFDCNVGNVQLSSTKANKQSIKLPKAVKATFLALMDEIALLLGPISVETGPDPFLVRFRPTLHCSS